MGKIGVSIIKINYANSYMLTIEYTVQLLKAYVEGRIHPDTHIELRQLFEQHPELFVQVDRLTDPTHLEAVLLDYKQLYAPAYRKQEQRVLDRIFTQINEEQVVRYKKNGSAFLFAMPQRRPSFLSWG